ncbi:DUF6350 family protein [Microbacterium enclense]|uniref:cell division protein PerM n=1 Tax=Microbacterium enclense TaxID=993073 RepID=UPI0020422472|nr:DUF6350 family protein [Microbacterium enclense]MCM3612936.1 DUF6350 family protein [Microbacterium enclense]
MHRLLVALLAALDAVLAAAGGIAVILAPLALLWVFGVGDPDWGALWPASAAVWHLGHLVPVTVTLPDTYLAATGIDPSLSTFTLSLAPLALAAFTALFAARSGARAAEAGAAVTGWLSGSVVFAGLAALVGVSANAELVASEVWLAILLPSLLFFVPSFIGAFVGSWRVGDDGPVDVLRERIERLPHAWAEVPALIVRGLALTTLGLIAVGAVVVVAGLIVGSGQVIGLYQASNADAIGAIVIALGQLMYLPTLVLWAVAFTAGPGFALGTDTAVTPAATQVGALPGIPVLGAVPDTTSSWLLLLALLPVGIGAMTGWMLRSRMPRTTGPEPFGPRLVVAVAVSVLTGGVGALFALASTGSIGPGRLADTGPEPGPLALALGLEVLVGLAILLLSPRLGGDTDEPWPSASVSGVESAGSDLWPSAPRADHGVPARLAAPVGSDLRPSAPRADRDVPARFAGPGAGREMPGWPSAAASQHDSDARPATDERPDSARPVPGAGAASTDAAGEELGESASVSDDDDVHARIRAAWAREPDRGIDDGPRAP